MQQNISFLNSKRTILLRTTYGFSLVKFYNCFSGWLELDCHRLEKISLNHFEPLNQPSFEELACKEILLKMPI